MKLAQVFLWFAVFAIFLIVVLGLAPFFRGRAYTTAKESTSRIIVISFLIFAPFFLAVVLLFPLLKFGIRPFVEKVVEFWATDKTMAIFVPATVFFLALAGISIPLAAIFHYLFGFDLFLTANKRYQLSPSTIEKNPTIRELLDIFSHCLNVAGKKKLGKVFLLDEASAPAVFSGCGIIGKSENLALLFSKDFVRAFEEKQLGKEEVEAIFFHEISHIVNKDYFLPLWSKMFIRSRLFFVAWASILIGFVCASVAFTKMEGLSAVFNWNLVSKVLILTIGYILLRGVIKILIGGILREREYLADNHATYHYTDRNTMTEAIKKSALLFTGGDKFSWLSFGRQSVTYAITEVPKEDAFSEIKKLFSDLFSREASWHPDPAKRIAALDEQRIALLRGKGKRYLKDVIVSTLFVTVFLFGAVLFLEFFSPEWLPRFHTPLNTFFILFYFLAICTLVIYHILPLQFWNTALFQKRLTASWTLFLTGKTWLEIHAKNYFIALIPSLLGRIVINVFTTHMRFFHWCRLHLLNVFLFSFGFATFLSVFLISRYWKQKKEKWPVKEEVPAEDIME